MTRPHEELGAKVRRLQHAVSEIHGQASFGGVTVRADANGRLTGLDISESAHAAGPRALTELIMRLYNEVADDVHARTTAILTELRDDPAVARIADATADAGPAPQPVQQRASHLPPTAPAPQHTAPGYPPQVPIQADPEPSTANSWISAQVARSRAARLRAEAELARHQASEWEEEEQARQWRGGNTW